MEYETQASLTAMFFQQAERLAERPFLWSKRDRVWRALSWQEVAGQVRLLARGLLSLGIAKGDRVALVSENRPEWLITDHAIMAVGAITVPGYTTSTTADYVHLLNDSGAKVVIVSTRVLAEKVVAAALGAVRPPVVVVIEELALKQDPGVAIRRWSDLITLGTLREDDIDATVTATARGDTACIIYTSGTGGLPKGVMLSHGAIIANCMGAENLLHEMRLDDEVFLSFLPLSHSYEHTAGQFFPISIGAQIYYAESIEQVAANMAEVRPTLMTAVPRLYEVIRARVLRSVERDNGVKATLFDKALRLGTKRIEQPEAMTLSERVTDRLLDLLVRKAVAERFGGRLKALVSGGAPLNYEVGLFFTALGVRLLQGYGQTETAPVVSCNRPFHVKLRTVGPPVKGVEVKIADDGEILVRGELVMQGYWNDADATRAVIKDGWLHTGDVGCLDEEGRIEITDRKRDIIVNSGGDNVSPQRIEGFLTLQPEIAQAMVYGNRRPHLVALLVPDADFVRRWAEQTGKAYEPEALTADSEFRSVAAAAVDRVNRSLSPIEKVRRFLLAAEPFTVDNGMCTPTLKIRRHVIVAAYGSRLEELYDERRS